MRSLSKEIAIGELQAGSLLIVDDEEPMRRLLGRILSEAGYVCEFASDAATAHARIAEGGVDLLLSDVQMPGESGLELVRHVLAERTGTAAIIISGIDDPGVAQCALEFGAYGYMTKPFKRVDVLIAVMNALCRRKLETEAVGYRGRLEAAVAARTTSLEGAHQQLITSRREAIERLSRAVEYRDPETGGHIERMSRYAGLIATHMGLHGATIEAAAQMHDLGKVGVGDAILQKPGPLSPEERVEMERHALIGYELLKGSESELLKLAAVVALTHHERFDGNGYPNGMTGVEIPLEGRIAAVADVFDALTSDRVYRPAFLVAEALEMIEAERGKHFDPKVLDAFAAVLDEILVIREQFSRQLMGAA